MVLQIQVKQKHLLLQCLYLIPPCWQHYRGCRWWGWCSAFSSCHLLRAICSQENLPEALLLLQWRVRDDFNIELTPSTGEKHEQQTQTLLCTLHYCFLPIRTTAQQIQSGFLTFPVFLKAEPSFTFFFGFLPCFDTE